MLIKKQTPTAQLASPFTWNPLGQWDSLFGGNNFFSELEPTCWDQKETEDSVSVSLAIPGFKREELDIQVHPRGFTVSGKSANYSRSYSIDRTLGCKVVADETQASLENGILTLMFKKEIAKKNDSTIKIVIQDSNTLPVK